MENRPKKLLDRSIGSITKVFTALALMQLSEEKVLNLDDPIAKFLPPTVKTPEFNGKAITLLTLATHTQPATSS